MAHVEQMTYIGNLKGKYPMYFKNKTVLEVGSLNVNGTQRVFFEDCDYIGIDVVDGRDVDIVVNGADYKYGERAVYDVVHSCEMLEHDDRRRETFRNMIRLLKPEGLLFMTCASTGRIPHSIMGVNNAEGDEYMNLTEEDICEYADLDKIFSEYEFEYNAANKDLYFYGIRKPKV